MGRHGYILTHGEQGLGWNRWREVHDEIRPDLSGENLRKSVLRDCDFRNADLRGANLEYANLAGANFAGADLTEAYLACVDATYSNFTAAVLHRAELGGSDFTGSVLKGAILTQAHVTAVHLSHADLSEANLEDADLRNAVLVGASLARANISNCRIHGVSAWDVKLEGARQWNLSIERDGPPRLLVDDLEVAQFVYLLLQNGKLRQVIDAITSKAVLVLGRFTPERFRVLEAIRAALRERHYLPMLFDFDKPATRDTLETVSTLAHLARFVIADLTDARSVLQELQRIVPSLPSVPVQPIIHRSQQSPGMVDHFRGFPTFLQVASYDDETDLLQGLDGRVLKPPEQWIATRGGKGEV